MNTPSHKGKTLLLSMSLTYCHHSEGWDGVRHFLKHPENEYNTDQTLRHTGQRYAGGSFALTENGYTGHGVYNGGWNIAPDWTIYFCGHFDQPASSRKTFTSRGDGSRNTTLASYGAATSTKGTYRQGGVFSFNETAVTSRVGISFISSDRACSNVEAEIPKGTKLQILVDQAQTKWNEDIFRKVTTTETNTTHLTQLYSYLYGMNLLPSNRTGENPLWDSLSPSYDDFFTLCVSTSYHRI